MNGSKIGSGSGFLDWTIVILAGLMFFRTADILSYFSPHLLSDLLMFDASYLYGMVCALAVEGVALALHFNHRAHGYVPAETVKWSLLAISGGCQVFDGFVITDTLSQQSDTMKALFQYGVPLLPLIIVVMIVKIGRLPEGDGLDFRPKRPFMGLRPMMNHLLNGNPAPTFPLAHPKEFDTPSPPFPPPESKSSEITNPTTGAKN